MSNENKLEIVATLKEGVGIGVKNIGPILVNLVLWVLTAWIPYLNVGTTIGLMIGVVSKASKGEAIPFTEIFDPKYRKYMGEFFLVSGLVGVGVGIGMVFAVIPGIVIGLAWCFAPLLVIDKGKNPMEAITLSNNLTYGNKGRMFGTFFIAAFAFGIVTSILAGIAGKTGSAGFIFLFIAALVVIFEIFVFIGIQASLYKRFAGNI
ncbi:MAG: hypothetical protein LBH44_01620 [Treponema sp.]|jgi:hypothetical protein|nr:hypothetical protein [Treponema sp.]